MWQALCLKHSVNIWSLHVCVWSIMEVKSHAWCTPYKLVLWSYNTGSSTLRFRDFLCLRWITICHIPLIKFGMGFLGSVCSTLYHVSLEKKKTFSLANLCFFALLSFPFQTTNPCMHHRLHYTAGTISSVHHKPLQVNATSFYEVDIKVISYCKRLIFPYLWNHIFMFNWKKLCHVKVLWNKKHLCRIMVKLFNTEIIPWNRDIRRKLASQNQIIYRAPPH